MLWWLLWIHCILTTITGMRQCAVLVQLATPSGRCLIFFHCFNLHHGRNLKHRIREFWLRPVADLSAMEWWSALKKQRWSQQKLIWWKFFELRCHWITFSPTLPKLTSKSATDVTFSDPVKVTSAECQIMSSKLLYSRKGHQVFYETDNHTFSAKVPWTCNLSIGQQDESWILCRNL